MEKNEQKRLNAKYCREYYLRRGICPKCKKHKVIEGMKYCEECLEKIRNYSRNYYHANIEEQRERGRIRRQKLREKRKSAGLCVKCGKHKISKYSDNLCIDCMLYERKYWRAYRKAKSTLTLEQKELNHKNASRKNIVIARNAKIFKARKQYYAKLDTMLCNQRYCKNWYKWALKRGVMPYTFEDFEKSPTKLAKEIFKEMCRKEGFDVDAETWREGVLNG